MTRPATRSNSEYCAREWPNTILQLRGFSAAMPVPQAFVLQRLVRAQFISLGLTLPRNWRPPTDDDAARRFALAFSEADRDAAPDPSPPALFQAASRNRLHVETQQSLSCTLGEYIDGICEAICLAWSQWHASASIDAITVNSAIASDGAVHGPHWLPLIMPTAPKRTPIMLRYSTAIATAISNGWQQYQATIRVPDLPYYPEFAAYPGPFAPPKPNVPMPVATLAQVTMPISKAVLKAEMVRIFDYPHAQFADELFACVAGGFERVFTGWQKSTMVTKVLGQGPVPSYAAPAVMFGPVVAGTAAMASGGLM